MLKKIFSLLLIILVTVTITGCKSKDYTIGDIEDYHYEETNDVTNYVKILTTKNKVILIELYPDIAPVTVKNFQDLVTSKFYDNLLFHRVIKDFMIQTGDPTGTGSGGSANNIKGEFASNGFTNTLKHEEGIVSMARGDDKNSASSQFFICVNDHEHLGYLDGNYAGFGKVIAGYDTVVEISRVATDSYDKPIKDEGIKTIRFVNVTKK